MENVTPRELKVLKVIADTMNDYQDGFSDVMFDDISSEAGLSYQATKGVLGSLTQKNLIWADSVNGEHNVYYLCGKAAEELLDFDLDF